MKINIKSKLTIGIGLMAGFVIMLWISGFMFINTLAKNSGAIIRDNIRTVTYVQQMEQALNNIYTMQVSAIGDANAQHIIEQESYRQAKQQFESILTQQENNITETGERALTGHIRSNFENLSHIFQQSVESSQLNTETIDRGITPAYLQMQRSLSQLINMNVDAIHRKNDIAQKTASNVTIYMSIIGAFCSLLGLAMLIRFPGYIADPVRELTKRIKDITNRNYDQKLEFRTGDEYEELAEAFNQMAEKLQEYENSNLHQIMSEKKRVETIINHMGDAVIGLDADNIILFANDKALELIGTKKEELVGRYAPDVASSNDLVHKMIRNLIRSNNRVENEANDDTINYIKTGKQNENYYTVETIPVRFSGIDDEMKGSHLGNIITLKNVTRFHELDQAKTNFLSIVYHELKTPISSIHMSTRLLEDERVGSLNMEQKELTSSIRKDITRMKRTTSDLLDLTKIESGNIQLNIGERQPKDLLEYAFETMMLQATQKNVEMKIEIEEDLPNVHVDSHKTVWVLINLISNAIRYSEPHDKITLEALQDKDYRYVLFAIKDTGKGIPPAYLDRIFEKYFQVDSTHKDHSGSGLGLSIAKEFITAQGGKIWVESKPGEGSSFYFNLPISKAQGK